MIDPVPELGGAHAQLALGHADLAKALDHFAARRSGEEHWRAVLGTRAAEVMGGF